MDDNNIRVGPSDYVPWQSDNKVCFIRMEGKLFGDLLMNLELRLSVEGSPISAGVSVHSIRCAKLVSSRGQGSILEAPSAYSCRHTPRHFADDEAFHIMEYFINGD